jgi:uncharacterized membrane protein
MFGTNEGRADRIARAVAGAGLLACSIRRMTRSQGKTLGVVGALIGATLLFTAATGSCPIYSALGIDTSTPSTGEPA